MRQNYFAAIATLLVALTLLGFSDNLFTNVGQPSNGDPKFILHGLFCLAWVLVFAAQAWLIRSRNVRLHRRLGIAAAIIAIGVTLSTLWVFIAVWKGWDAMEVWGKANRILLPSYAVLILLGYLNRSRPDFHKRLLLIATLYMLEPVLSRAFDPFDPLLLGFTDEQVDRAWWIFFTVTWNALFLSLFAYDWLTTRRIHRITALGYAWFCAIWTAIWFV